MCDEDDADEEITLFDMNGKKGEVNKFEKYKNIGQVIPKQVRSNYENAIITPKTMRGLENERLTLHKRDNPIVILHR